MHNKILFNNFWLIDKHTALSAHINVSVLVTGEEEEDEEESEEELEQEGKFIY